MHSQVTPCLTQGLEMTLMALGTAISIIVLLEAIQLCELTVNSFICHAPLPSYLPRLGLGDLL